MKFYFFTTVKIKTEALNGDFVFTEDKGAENNFEIWIILVAVTLGLLVLIMFVIGLYKVSYFLVPSFYSFCNQVKYKSFNLLTM